MSTAVVSHDTPATTAIPAPDLEQLRAQREVVRLARVKLDAADAIAEELETRFYDVHRAAFDTRERAKAEVEAAETALKALGMKSYLASSNKAPIGGIGIRVRLLPRYDRMAADAWSKEKGMCRRPEQLDVEAFETLCRQDALRPAFVTMEPLAQVTISDDLAKAIEKERLSNLQTVVAA